MKKNKVALAFILMVTGFIVAFSYQYVQKQEAKERRMTMEQWKREHQLRTQLIEEQEGNRERQQQLDEIRAKIHNIEQKLAKQKTDSAQLVKKLSNFRMINGQTFVEGPGIMVTLSDADYVPGGKNPNNYIVHQQDIQEVIYELYAIGAEAISLNGQRLSTHSYIECVGPVVKVDGERYTAPFIVRAIGDPELLMNAINMNGGTAELLIARGIDVTIETKDHIKMKPLL